MSKPKALTKQEKAKDAYLKRHFHSSLEEFRKVLKHQNGRCAMCKKLPSEFTQGFALDHRHKDGLLRGLLCWKCNRAIGAFQRFHPEAVELFSAAFEYLLHPPFTSAIGEERFTLPGKIGTKKRAKLLAKLKQQNLGEG